MTDTLKLKARGTALIVDHKAMSAGARRFIGRKHDATIGRNGGWPPADKPAEVSNTDEFAADYRRAVKHGDLWAADEATAEACGVKFDPLFGEQPAPPEQHVDPEPAPAAEQHVDPEVKTHD